MQRIYLDNSATTKIDPKVIEAMNKSYVDFANPSSIHSFGQEAQKHVSEARKTVAKFLNCEPEEIVFTSGGSEADNLAIRGIVDSALRKKMNEKPHVVTTAIEHHAVLHTIQDLEEEGKIEASYLKPGKGGVVKASDIAEAIKPNTILVSVMYVNNETGSIQPIEQIGKLIQGINLEQKVLDPRVIGLAGEPRRKPEDDKKSRVYFHTDAVQATEFCEMDTKKLGVDMLSMSAHKIHGPKGIGVLFVKKGTAIIPQITGGDHEFRLRAGTENVAGMVGMAEAIKLVEESKANTKTIEALRSSLEERILKEIPETFVNGKGLRAPHILNISFKNAEGEAIILNLDFLGIAVSSGSACTARSLDPSHVLSAMDLPHELSHGAIRFSLSRETTKEEIDRAFEVLPGIIKKLREMSPFG